MTQTDTISEFLTDLNLSYVQKQEKIEQAINLAAAYGYFSLCFQAQCVSLYSTGLI